MWALRLNGYTYQEKDGNILEAVLPKYSSLAQPPSAAKLSASFILGRRADRVL